MRVGSLCVLSLFFLLTTSCAPAPGLTSDGLPISERRIFVTSMTYDGNLGGMSGADEKCQTAASAAGLSRTYLAVLSDQNPSNLSVRISGNESLYEISSTGQKKLVAGSVTLFVENQQLNNPVLSYTETGANVNASSTATFWMATDAFGWPTNNACTGWTSNSNLIIGDTGTTASGTVLGNQTSVDCSEFHHLVCISL